MPDNKIEVLLITDDVDVSSRIRKLIYEVSGSPFLLVEINEWDQARIALQNERYEVFLLDETLQNKPTLPLLQKSLGFGLKSPVIYLFNEPLDKQDEDLVEGITSDYLGKGSLSADYLADSIWHSIEKFELLNKLFEKQIRYQSLFERSLDAIFMCDPEKKIVQVNQSMKHLLGYDKDTIEKLYISDLFEEQDDYKAFNAVLSKTHSVNNFETVLRSNDDSNINCLLTVLALLDTEGKIQGYQGVAHDITAQKRANLLMSRSERLAMTARLIRSLAHEVRNPLTNVSLAIEQLREETEGNNDTTTYLDIIDRSATRINTLITELLKSSEATKLEFEGHSIHRLLDETIDLANDRLQLKNVNLKKDYRSEVDNIPIDQAKLKIALLNIVMNGIEATENGQGELIIATNSSNNHVEISIKDNGSGMDQRQLKHLFDPFYTGKQNGIGLGLTTSQNIISGHQGSIDVSSDLGDGTEFIIHLPVKRRKSSENE